MKLFLAFTILTFAFQFSSAETDGTPSLKRNMKQAGTIFKSIGAGIHDPAKNLENAKSVEQMAELFRLTYSQLPDALQDVPEAQRAEAFAGYQKMIQATLDLCTELQAAFNANDNALAIQIYEKLKDLKEEGHDKYNP